MSELNIMRPIAVGYKTLSYDRVSAGDQYIRNPGSKNVSIQTAWNKDSVPDGFFWIVIEN